MKYLIYTLAAVLATTACGPAQMQHMQALATVATATTVPFKYSGNHIWVPATVDGKTSAFVFDTGGAASLTPALTKELGLQSIAKAQIYGGGNLPAMLDVVRPKRASIGEATLDDGMFLVLPPDIQMLSPYPAMPFGGILGREFFGNIVVTIDYAKQTLTLTNPGAFHADPGATAIPMTMRSGAFPNVEASVDGVTGTFDIDAGSAAGLSLTTAFAKDNGILAKMPKTVDVRFGRGVGGVITGSAGRVQTFTIGGFTFNNLYGTVVHATGGAFATPGLGGNIGGEILRRFTVTVDAPGKTLYLAKNDAFGDPFTFTRTGLFFDLKSGTLVVQDVVAGSPAQKAGIRAGDVLVMIDGRAASAFTPNQLKGISMQPAGTVVHVKVQRAGKPLAFDVKLADLI